MHFRRVGRKGQGPLFASTETALLDEPAVAPGAAEGPLSGIGYEALSSVLPLFVTAGIGFVFQAR
jgi:hypothetical protein